MVYRLPCKGKSLVERAGWLGEAWKNVVRPGPVASSDQLCNISSIPCNPRSHLLWFCHPGSHMTPPGASGPKHYPCQHGQHRGDRWVTLINPFPQVTPATFKVVLLCAKPMCTGSLNCHRSPMSWFSSPC